MAINLGRITIDKILVVKTDVSPMDGIGLEAPIGSFGSAIDGSGMFYKSGALNTDWVNLSSIFPSLVQKNANYTVTIFDITVECTANSFTVTLLSAVGIKGKIFNINNSGNGRITIIVAGGGLINGKTTQYLSKNSTMSVQSNNTNYIII
jgi:hypothetical protein